MATKKPMKREFTLEEFQEQATEAFGGVPGISITLPNNDTVFIPHPMLLPDDRQWAVERVTRRADEDRDEDGNPNEKIDGKDAEPQSVRLARAVLGEKDQQRMLDGGGSSNIVALAWQMMTEGMQGPKPLK